MAEEAQRPIVRDRNNHFVAPRADDCPARELLHGRLREVRVLHMWTKQRTVDKGKRALAIVVDDDDVFRRSALRALRRIDMGGIGLLDTGPALRMCVTTPIGLCIVPASRCRELEAALARLPPQARPIVVASTARADEPQPRSVAALVQRASDADEIVAVLNRVVRERGKKKRVLVVDDDTDLRELFSVLLEEEGYDVVPAPHGKAAWNAIDAGLKPDVILLDVMMPFMDGREVYARLQGSPLKGTPVVVITAGTADPLGDAEVLRKPIDLSRLLEAVARGAALVR
jgi:CheY-like chemotaxis protein